MVIAGESHITHHFRRFDGAAAYAEHVRPFLLAAEAENNVLLGILNRLVTGDHDYGEPMLLGAVERIREHSDGATEADDSEIEVVGCIWRTPPYNKLGMTTMPEAAVSVAAEGVHQVETVLEGLLGPVDTVSRFARSWVELTGATFREGMRQGVYQLDRVIPPTSTYPGEMVKARAGDLQMVVDWGVAFRHDTHAQAGDPAALGRRLIREGSLYLWVDGGRPRSMAAAIAFTDNGARVGWVYTPPEDRGRGYATSLVAELSQLLLDQGRTFCFLYADLANPTSTGIYERLGYRTVVEAMDIIFDAR